MQKLISVITSYFMHRFTHNLNLGWVSTWMTLTYILPTVPNRNEWKLCCKLHTHNYTCIPKILGWRGTLDPTGQLVENIIYVTVGVTWCGSDSLGQEFVHMIQEDEVVDEILAQLSTVVEGESVMPCHCLNGWIPSWWLLFAMKKNTTVIGQLTQSIALIGSFIWCWLTYPSLI